MVENEKCVKIPKSLSEKLKPFGARFIKVAKPILGVKRSGKKAVEHGWQDKPYKAHDPELQKWLNYGGNYGIICGKGLYEIDLDDQELQEKFEDFVNTFTVKTGRPHGRHYFVRSDVSENGVIIDKNGKNLGNIQVRNKYVVGAGSNHHTGNKYEIIKDISFAWISKEQLEGIFGKQLQWSKQHLSEKEAEEEIETMKSLGFEIQMVDLVDISQLRQISVYELQGSHPIHGSETGNNFCINFKKNCWHCFRCNSGGGALMWLAVKHKLIRCDEAQKGALKGEIFKKVLEIAKEEGFEIELQDRNEEISPDVSKYFERRSKSKRWTFVPAFLAEEIIKEFHYITRETDEVIFLYHADKGVYTPNGEAHVKRQIKKRLGKHFSRHRQNEVLAYIEAATIQKVKDTPPYLIAVKNGILNIKTGKLEKFTPEYFILNALPVKYDPKAKCPKTLKFLDEVVHKDDKQVLQEWAGYCLYRRYPIHKALMLIGEGANGKSTWMEVLRTLLNNENVSTEPLQSFEANRFSVVSLYGKLANIYPDLSDRSLRATGSFKMLTGGDTITAEYKFKNRFCFKNYAKLMFSANKIPECKDDTTAFFRRWIIINFPNQFLPDDPKTDPNLIDKLTTEKELSGFFNWALEGLKRLLKNGKFSHAKSVEETRQQYTRASNPVKAFVMDNVEFEAGSFVTKQALYEAFIEYCKKMNLPTVSKNSFGIKLPEYMPKISTIRKRIKGKSTRCWGDIAMRGTLGTQSRGIGYYSENTSKKIENTESVLNRKEGDTVYPVSPESMEEWQDAFDS